MTKNEFIKAVAAESGFTQKDTRETLNAMQAVVFDNLRNDTITIMDGIVLRSVFKDENIIKHPSTKEEIVVPPHYVPYCKFGKPVKEAINRC